MVHDRAVTTTAWFSGYAVAATGGYGSVVAAALQWVAASLRGVRLHRWATVDYDLDAMAMSGRRTFFRIVRTDTPSLWDFTSNEARGMTLRDPTPETCHMWSGISVYDALDRARKLATRRPELGQFIAILSLPDDEAVLVERTGARAGHHTIWGDPTRLLGAVVGVEPV